MEKMTEINFDLMKEIMMEIRMERVKEICLDFHLEIRILMEKG